MTIAGVVKWIGEQSAWWLLAIPAAPVVFVMLWEEWERLQHKLWDRRTKRRVTEIEKEINACKTTGNIEAIAWKEWERQMLTDLLTSPEDYERRLQAMTDAAELAEDQAFLAAKRAEYSKDPIVIKAQEMLRKVFPETP